MSEFDPELSQADRIQYLRDRGIQIEIPGEKREAASSDNGDAVSVKPFTVVRIPCDDAKKIEEMTIELSDIGGDQLMTALRPHFSSSNLNDFNMDSLKATLKEQHGNQDIEISESALQTASEMGNVENFPLDHPCPQNKMKGVNIYLDEASQLKNLPPNSRATALADTCGFKGVPFSGDVYIGRFSMAANGVIRNTHFGLPDLDTARKEGEWVQGAQGRNYDHNSKTGKIDMSGGASTNDPQVGDNAALGFTWTETADTMDLVYVANYSICRYLSI
jgi:hypothetical protein